MTSADIKKGQAPKTAARLRELAEIGGSLLPIWIRCPSGGPEHFSGFSRAKLYQLNSEKKIRSVSVRDPGKGRGTRLFNLRSILDYIERCENEGALAA